MRRVTLFVLLIASLIVATGCPQEPEEEGQPPVVTLPGGNIYQLAPGDSLTLSPGFEHLTESAVIRWIRNGKVVGGDPVYVFTADTPGVYYLTVEVTTEYGKDFLEVRIEVAAPDPGPGPEPTPPPVPAESDSVSFERQEYHVAVGRTLRLLPLDIDSTKQYSFVWLVDGQTVQEGGEPLYRFEAVKQGLYTVEFRLLRDGVKKFADTLQVLVCPPEGTYRRPAGAGSSPNVARVYDFTPAPGQYVNENYTATTMEEACAYALGRMGGGNYVSLGGFGGSMAVGFDHSIANDGDYNFAIKEASYTNYSEPGIVWVMQDEDGNGLPDDTWYELKGSEYGLSCTVQDYAVTYYRPEAPAQNVNWTDNHGGSGCIDYLSAFHKQDYYYPLWIKEDRYTLRGSRLEARNYDQSGRGVLWINPDYGWGYADNHSEVDMLPERATGVTKGWNHFRIADAVTFDGRPANLQYIDFIKVQTGLNTKSGWLGEVSTEVMGVVDFNLVK